jgi:hypothetical protein
MGRQIPLALIRSACIPYRRHYLLVREGLAYYPKADVIGDPWPFGQFRNILGHGSASFSGWFEKKHTIKNSLSEQYCPLP